MSPEQVNWLVGLFGLGLGWILHGILFEMERRKQGRRKVWRQANNVDRSTFLSRILLK
jgi:hypothetical protein